LTGFSGFFSCCWRERERGREVEEVEEPLSKKKSLFSFPFSFLLLSGKRERLRYFALAPPLPPPPEHHGRRRRPLYAVAVQGAERRGASVREREKKREREALIDGSMASTNERMPSRKSKASKLLAFRIELSATTR
jgi:hypothetical protein